MPTKGVAPKQPKARIRRILAKREPKLIENTKKTLLLRGNNTCQLVTDVLRDLHRLAKPHCKLLSKKNDIHPFESEQGIEFLCQKNDCSLFGLVSHSKKRPNNLVLGRTFDGHVLDMFELGINHYQGVEDFHGRTKKIGSKPCVMFVGDQWAYEEPFTRLQNLLLDWFRGDKVDKITLKGLDHVVICTVLDSQVYVRHYAHHIQALGIEGKMTPLLELSSMGPHLDLSIRRHKLASADLFKAACKQPKQLKPQKIKNISRNALGDKEGKLHLVRQDLSSMRVKRVKALRVTSKRKPEDSAEDAPSNPGKKPRVEQSVEASDAPRRSKRTRTA